MRVMFVVTRGDSIGGAQGHVRDLALRVVADGGEARVVTGVAGPLTEGLEAAGVPWEICPGMLREIDPLRDVQAVRALAAIVRRVRPDVVDTHSSKAGIVGRIAARLAGVPVVFTAHGWAFTGGVPEPKRTAYREIERACAPLAAKIICVSAHDGALAARARVGSSGRRGRGRVRVIRNGVTDVDPRLLADPGEETARPRAVMVARFDQQKDHATLLAALARVPALDLELIGDGPGRGATERLVADLGLGDRVACLGQRSDIAERLAAAHLFVLSSRWEGFPRSTLEAMRAGLPVVVSDAGGSAEAVTEGATGHVIAPGDVDALAARLARLAGDPASRAAMGAAGRRRYEAEFTFDRMYGETSGVWAEVAGA